MGRRKNSLSFKSSRRSVRGVMSLIFAGLSGIILLALLILSFIQEGQSGTYAGSSAVVAFLVAILGIVYALAGFREKETGRFLVVFGLVLNVLLSAVWTTLFVMGMN